MDNETSCWNIKLSQWILFDPDPDLISETHYTECFQQMMWIPCVLLAILLPFNLQKIRKSSCSSIPWNIISISKIIFTTCLLLISVFNFGITHYFRLNERKILELITLVIQSLSFLVALILVWKHRSSGIRTSGVLFIFWLCLTIASIPQFRSEIAFIQSFHVDKKTNLKFWKYIKVLTHMIYFPIVLVMFLLNCIADKRPKKSEKTESITPEEGASFFRKLFYQWYDSMTWRGFRKELKISDLYGLLDEDKTKNIIPKFYKYWKDISGKNNGIRMGSNHHKMNFKTEESNGSVLPALVKTYGFQFIFTGILKLFYELLGFISPTILGWLIGFTKSDEPIYNGIGYVVMMFGLLLITILLNSQYYYLNQKIELKIKSTLISAIYRKSLKISSINRKDVTGGEVTNLMAVDAGRIGEQVPYLHIMWSGPLVFALSLYFLYNILGVAIFAGLGVLILMIPLNIWVVSKTRHLEVQQMKTKDQRIKVMSEVINGMRVLKMYAWEPSFQKKIEEFRRSEINILRIFSKYVSLSYVTWSLVPFIVSFACFATFVLMDDKNVLDATVAFKSLALLNILRGPITLFPIMVSMASQALVSLARINKFMNTKELDPNNVSHDESSCALKIKEGTFKWDQGEIALRNINLEVKKGELAAVVGPVGSGKSTLISALLGELHKAYGTVNTDGEIAYISQQAWIQNSTLQENILFGKPMNQNFYEKIIEACALKPDLEMLPGGDQTEIGEKGINLSGGQKQRIALARAVYSNAEIYLFDDPLSAVDSHVGKHIFDNVIGPKGLLVDKTRFLVTHGISYLPQVATIYVMSNGQITESGCYNFLLDQKGDFSEFILHYVSNMEDEEEFKEIQETLVEDCGGISILERALSNRSTLSRKSIKRNTKARKDSETNESADLKDVFRVSNDGKLIEKERSFTGKKTGAIYWSYIKSVGLWITFVMFVLNAMGQGCVLYGNIWLTQWSADTKAKDSDRQNLYIGVYGGLVLLHIVPHILRSVLFDKSTLSASKNLHKKILKNIIRLPMSFFDTTPIGRIVNRLSKDMVIVDRVLPFNLRAWFNSVFNILSTIAVISWSTPIFLVVLLPILLIYFCLQAFYVSTSRQLKRFEAITMSPLCSHFGESLSGLATIRAYKKQEAFVELNTKKLDDNQTCNYNIIVAVRWLSLRLDLISNIIIFFASLFAVFARDTLDPAIMGLSVTCALSVSQALTYFVRISADIDSNIVSLERLEEYADLKEEGVFEKVNSDKNWPALGEIEFDNVKVRYREGLDFVLKGISFNVKSMEKVGIIGRTGSGKSSLTLALFRIIEAADGKIVIDGKNIVELGLHNLRSRLTIIPQDPVLFSGTLRMNIDPFNHYSDDDIWRVLEHSHLKAFVKGLPTGLLHEISEGGENLSVGQRQLVCLARALLRKTKVLVLDEATAAVDLETDDLIQKTIRTEFADCTILTIAHRLNTIIDSDKVVVLDKGHIAEFDSPENLLANPNTIFYGMAKNSGLIGNYTNGQNGNGEIHNIISTKL